MTSKRCCTVVPRCLGSCYFFLSAIFRISFAFFTKVNFIFDLASFGSSSMSFLFLWGMMTVLIPACFAAMIFSLRPPMGRTRPFKIISHITPPPPAQGIEQHVVAACLTVALAKGGCRRRNPRRPRHAPADG